MAAWARYCIFPTPLSARKGAVVTGPKYRFPYAIAAYHTQDQAHRNLAPGYCIIFDRHETGLVLEVR